MFILLLLTTKKKSDNYRNCKPSKYLFGLATRCSVRFAIRDIGSVIATKLLPLSATDIPITEITVVSISGAG